MAKSIRSRIAGRSSRPRTSAAALLAAAWIVAWPTVASAHGRPSLSARLNLYLRARPGTVSVAVTDLETGRRWAINPAMRSDAASVVKVDILQTLLYRTGGHLDAAQRSLASAMIEQSDNDAATALWNEAGGAGGVADYNRRLHLRCTAPNLAWGLTVTCAADQVRLLAALISARSPLVASARSYELSLMAHVVPAEAWGVSAGPAGARVALKNGWLPYGTAPWYINSIGYVHGHWRRYLIAVLTRSPSEAVGIATVEGVSRIVWSALESSTVARIAPTAP